MAILDKVIQKMFVADLFSVPWWQGLRQGFRNIYLEKAGVVGGGWGRGRGQGGWSAFWV